MTAQSLEREKDRLGKMIENYEKAIEALIEKAQQMLMYPLAKTVRTTTEDGKQVVTEVHPAKWKMSDAAEFYSDALALLNRIEALKVHADRLERMEATEELPAWVPAYLAAWGGERESGTRVTVSQAAEMAGTSASNVRNLRTRSEQFRRLEWMARHGETRYMQSMVEAGLRGNALLIFAAFMQLVQEGNTQAVLKAMEWLQDKPVRVKVEDDNLLSDEERARLVMGLLDAARVRRDGGDPPG